MASALLKSVSRQLYTSTSPGKEIPEILHNLL